jgi:pre-mRNA-splicing helicase BRR2
MRPAELGELVRAPKLGKLVHKMIATVPRFALDATIQPLTRALLRIDLVLTPDFRWDDEHHGYVEPFLILVRRRAPCSHQTRPYATARL